MHGRHLTLQEREILAQERAAGRTQRQIADRLGCHPSTVSGLSPVDGQPGVEAQRRDVRAVPAEPGPGPGRPSSPSEQTSLEVGGHGPGASGAGGAGAILVAGTDRGPAAAGGAGPSGPVG